MKAAILSLLLLGFFSTTQAQIQPRLFFSNDTPVAGETVQITYRIDHPEAVFATCEGLALIERNASTWKDFDIFPMHISSDGCSASYHVYENSRYLVFYVSDGKTTDQNDGEFWDLLVHDETGTPVNAALLFRGYSHANRILDAKKAAELERRDTILEAQAHPENLFSVARAWNIELENGANIDSLFEVAHPVILDYWKQNEGQVSAISAVSYAYRQFQKPQDAEVLRQQAIEKDPTGEIAADETFSLALRLSDPSEKVKAIESFLQGFPEAVEDFPSYKLRSILTAYRDAGDKTGMLLWAQKSLDAETFSPGRVAKTLVDDFLRVGMNEEALAYARMAVDLIKNDPLPQFYRQISDSVWVPARLNTEMRIRAEANKEAESRLTLATVLMRMDKAAEALGHLEFSSQNIVDNTDVFRLLAQAYLTLGRPEDAFKQYVDLARQYPEDSVAVGGVKLAYEAANGSLTGFESVQAELESVWAARPQPVFSVDDYYIENDPFADLEATVKLAQEGQKRIMLFVGGEWCTWCHALTRYFKASEPVARLLQENYIIMKVNYSTENENKAFLKQYPPISGYPHLYILDHNANLLHSQETGSLEQGVGMAYNEAVVLDFLEKWAPSLQPEPR